MTELETMLQRQLTTLSSVCEQQFGLHAERLSAYEEQLLLQSERIEDLLRLAARLAVQLNSLSAQLESEF